MHIPDGFVNAATAATTYAVAAGGVAIAVRRLNKQLGEREVPLMGVMAAFVFAAQMLNFPVLAGTSGHLIGATLTAVLLGPWSGVLIMTCVLAVQSLLFQDGGLTALGANIFNMGLVASFVGYYLYTFIMSLLGEGRRPQLVSSFVGAWASVVAASVFCSLELAASGIASLLVVLPTMAGIHALIGIGEGMITAVVLGFIMSTRRDLLQLKRT